MRSSLIPPSSQAVALGAVLALIALLASRGAHAATVYFAHDDATYLRAGQHEGGAALVPEVAAESPLPLVVFLHGTNPEGDLHMWLGGGGHDLRPVAKRLYHSQRVRPFILAGPSQTRASAHGRVLWNNFDLDSFVDDVARAVDGRATIDREAVVFVGHSGAGCNPRGGLATHSWFDMNRPPLAVVAIDPCLDQPMGNAFGHLPARVPLWLMWQSVVWPRQPAAFEHALAEQRSPGHVVRIERLPVAGPNPHDAIVPLALERAARALFANHESPSDAS